MKTIELRPVKIPENYRKKWNISGDDYCHLYINGVKTSNTYWRKGGLRAQLDEPYFMILKYVEEYFSDKITTDKKLKPHLAGHWCIMDNNCEQKVVFDTHKHGYLQGGIIYSLENKYYNIETGECYGESYNSISTDKYLFINNEYDKDKTKRGVLKIDKDDGSTELFPEVTKPPKPKKIPAVTNSTSPLNAFGMFGMIANQHSNFFTFCQQGLMNPEAETLNTFWRDVRNTESLRKK